MATAKFRVLTLDGGGMRGLYTAYVLRGLAKLFDHRFVNMEPDIGKSFNLICGTSTGAILACGLAAGIPLSKICELYINNGPLIFPRPVPKPTDKIYMLRWLISHLTRPAASGEKLYSCLKETFKEESIGHIYRDRKIALCIPVVDAIDFSSRIFKTPHFPNKHRDNNYRLADICMASASAPIFFPLSEQRNPDNKYDIRYFVDGGLWANNPIMIGLVEALLLAQKDSTIEIISVGTCDRPCGDPHAAKKPAWGILKWMGGIKAIEISLSAQSYSYNHMAIFLAKAFSESGRSVNVVRLEESIKSPEQYGAIGLDRADHVAINTLVNLAEKDAAHIHSKILSQSSLSDSVIIGDIFCNLKELV